MATLPHLSPIGFGGADSVKLEFLIFRQQHTRVGHFQVSLWQKLVQILQQTEADVQAPVVIMWAPPRRETGGLRLSELGQAWNFHDLEKQALEQVTQRTTEWQTSNVGARCCLATVCRLRYFYNRIVGANSIGSSLECLTEIKQQGTRKTLHVQICDVACFYAGQTPR